MGEKMLANGMLKRFEDNPTEALDTIISSLKDIRKYEAKGKHEPGKDIDQAMMLVNIQACMNVLHSHYMDRAEPYKT